MGTDISFEGLESVLERLEGIYAPSECEKVMGKACALVERTAKQNAPKGNGELRRSIQSKIENDGGEIRGVVFTPLEYAPYVEFGTGLFAENGGRKDVPWVYCDERGEFHTTSGMQPQPYLRPALYENREKITRLLKGGS